MLLQASGQVLSRIFTRSGWGCGIACCVLSTGTMLAAEPSGLPAGPAPITDARQLWSLSPEQKGAPQPIRIEGRVSYYDPSFKLCWLENHDVGTYILLGSEPPLLRSGQRVRLEGTLVCDQGLSASRLKVTVLEEHAPIVPLDTRGRINDLTALGSRIVAAEGYVDGQQYIDENHVRLSLVVEDRPAVVWVKPADPDAIPNWTGKFVRVQALYSSRFDPTNTQTTVELWVGDESQIVVTGSLDAAAIFKQPPTPIGEIYRKPVGTEVMVRGRVEKHQSGLAITLRDATGEVEIRSVQHERLAIGRTVEAVGKVFIFGSKWVLRSGLYRAVAEDDSLAPAAPRFLETVGEIRQLSLDEARRAQPVKILGMVTWSMPDTPFFFVQDVTGGIRVRFDPKKMEAPQLGKYLLIAGVTYDGGFVPAVEMHDEVDRGSMSPPDPRSVTFDQAITGKEDGQWVEMRGFIQRVESDGDWRWIYVTTPAGEFVGHLQSPVNFVANPGSLIRMQGVCEATADKTGRLTGVMLRVPFLHSITIEEDAPVDYFDLPLRPIAVLRQLTGARDLTRVRIAATVLHATPGRSIYVEEGDAGLQILTRETQPLAPGDRIDVVGILGWEGSRIVLREAVCRKTGNQAPPEPVVVSNPGRLAPTLDARLVTVRGLLIDASRQQDRLRLTLQSGATLFEAWLDQSPEREAAVPPVGSGLQLTGIYLLAFDDARQTRGFALQLRSPRDVVVYQKARVWTVQRALTVSAALAGLSLLGLGWITALRRRVHQQTQQIRAQLEKQARLEGEVQRAARLESLGLLAGGIAHDFNNLLTIIMGNLGLAMLDTKISESTSRCLLEIERGTSRARALTRQLLTFAKGGDPLRATVSLPEVVKSAADRALHGTKVRATYDFAADLWNADVDKDQIGQAVQNLALNAVQAMPQGGELVIVMRNDPIASGARLAIEPGRYVKVSVSDTGEGIGPDVLPKIFDPYFSTRKTGSGLGLATVYSIVKRHDGAIEVESAPERGTTFNLWLPAGDGELPIKPAPRAAVFAETTPGQKSRRVLLMDDEPSIQNVVCEVLERMGLRPTVVADGGAALREFSIAQHKREPFDLLILDLTIPGGMGGKEVMELVRKLDERVPAIVSSGYSSDPVMANFAEYGFQAMVQKPYEIGELAAVIERLLGRAAAPH